MSSSVQGLMFLLFGAVCIVFSRSLGARAGEFQRRFFGVTLAPRFLQLGYLFGGIVFCLMGGLALLGLIKFGR